MTIVLLVDDNTALRDTYAEALRCVGWSVMEAADGEAALACLSTGPVDIVVSDLLMPQMDGIELLIAMREDGFKQPVVMMTGGLNDIAYRGDDSVTPCLSAARLLGAARILRKPLLPSELVQEIRAQVA